MREMVLNHASAVAVSSDDSQAQLRDLSVGMSALIREHVVAKSLRMSMPMSTIACGAYPSLYGACVDLLRSDRDAGVLLMSLTQRAPLEFGLDVNARNRLLACESLSYADEDARPLLLCAVNDWIVVGFPSREHWDHDHLEIEFEELLDSGEFDQVVETVDNLTRSFHATAIISRNRERLRAGASPGEIWARRGDVFPSLLFGPEVEGHLQNHASLLPTIVNKLVHLEESALNWTKGPVPIWSTKVTSESRSTMRMATLREARLFESSRGGRRLFEWHARVGNGFRIHLRLENDARLIEVGYIGPHLPT